MDNYANEKFFTFRPFLGLRETVGYILWNKEGKPWDLHAG